MYRLIAGPPFFYGWAILFAAGSSMVVPNSAASLTSAFLGFATIAMLLLTEAQRMEGVAAGMEIN